MCFFRQCAYFNGNGRLYASLLLYLYESLAGGTDGNSFSLWTRQLYIEFVQFDLLVNRGSSCQQKKGLQPHKKEEYGGMEQYSMAKPVADSNGPQLFASSMEHITWLSLEEASGNLG